MWGRKIGAYISLILVRKVWVWINPFDVGFFDVYLTVHSQRYTVFHNFVTIRTFQVLRNGVLANHMVFHVRVIFGLVWTQQANKNPIL